MDARAIAKARSRLRVAEKAVQELAGYNADFDTFLDDPERFNDDIERFRELWYIFLAAAKNVWTVLEQGSKASPQSKQWFGGKKNVRRADPLLQYMFEARNDDEHGLQFMGEHVPGRITGSRRVETPEGPAILIEGIPPHIKLVAVRGRGGRIIQPPTEHKGQPLSDNSPHKLAALCLAYLSSLVIEAAALS